MSTGEVRLCGFLFQKSALTRILTGGKEKEETKGETFNFDHSII